MYESLQIPWSAPATASPAEQRYRSAGLLKTKGTVSLLPPPTSELVRTYNAPPRPKTRMSAGAVALCKHFERGGASSERGRPHPFWTLPVGSNDNKTLIASKILEAMLEEAKWKNVMLLHAGVAVYEIRNGRGFGMRWTLDLEVDRDDTDDNDDSGGGGGGGGNADGNDGNEKDERTSTTDEKAAVTSDVSTADPSSMKWKIAKTTFRGFLEPIEGLEHELDNT